jgi:hypothetical protein
MLPPREKAIVRPRSMRKRQATILEEITGIYKSNPVWTDGTPVSLLRRKLAQRFVFGQSESETHNCRGSAAGRAGRLVRWRPSVDSLVDVKRFAFEGRRQPWWGRDFPFFLPSRLGSSSSIAIERGPSRRLGRRMESVGCRVASASRCGDERNRPLDRPTFPYQRTISLLELVGRRITRDLAAISMGVGVHEGV